MVVTVSGLGPLAAVGISRTQLRGPRVSLLEAVLLGIVEGVTEFLPVSSTGHLAITEGLLGLSRTNDGRRAADAYAIVIQIGAVPAVLGLCRGRIASLWSGMLGRDVAGRRLALAVFVAFTPSAVAGLLLGDQIEDQLFSTGTSWRPGSWEVPHCSYRR